MLKTLADSGFHLVEPSRFDWFATGGDLGERGFIQLDGRHCAEIVVYEREDQRMITAHVLKTREVIATMTDPSTLDGCTCEVVEIDDFARFMRFVAEHLIATADLVV